MRMPNVYAALATTLLLSLPSLAQPVAPVSPPPPPSLATLHTRAEATDWQATSTSAEVVALLDAIAHKSPYATRVSMGNTREQRDMPVIVLSDPPVMTAAEARELATKEGRAIVLLFANIHAGEVDAKEAYLMLARELALPDHPQRHADFADLLKHLIICIAPNYNADGNDRFGAIEVNRPGQGGPAWGAGQRHNSMDLDLNRDWGKLESPEARNIVKFIRDWDPHVIVDGHTTNGSWHRYLLTYAGPKVPAGDNRLIEWTRDVFFPKIDDAMLKEHKINTFFYGDFENVYAPDTQDTPQGTQREHSKWETFAAQARYSTGYLGLRGRIGLLSESYSYSTYKDRILGSRALALEVLRQCARDRAMIRDLIAKADEDGAGIGPTGSRPIAIRGKAAIAPGKVSIKGYVEERRNGRWVSTGDEQDYEVELWNRYDPDKTVTRPAGYAFLVDAPHVIANLEAHGVRVDTLTAPTTLDCDVYTISKVRNASRLFQGHALLDIEATSNTQSLPLPAGTKIVLANQPLGTLAIYLLEPECEDGLATWNFFDQWVGVSERFPVVRLKSIPQATQHTK